MRLIDIVRERTGDEFFLMMHGDATYGIPSGSNMTEWCARLVEKPDEVKANADSMVDNALSGYVFSTSNCIFTGMRFSRYELILDVWRREGILEAGSSEE